MGPALGIGACGMLASVGWFTAMTLQNASYVRAVGQVERRLSEAARMGFRTAFVSPRGRPRAVPEGIRIVETADVRELVEHLFP